MDGPAQYLQWGFIQISIANLIVIGLMIIVFALAVLVRFPEKKHLPTLEETPPEKESEQSHEKTEVKL